MKLQNRQIRKKYADYFNYLQSNGIYTAPSQFEAMFVSVAHTDEDIEKTCNIIEEYKNKFKKPLDVNEFFSSKHQEAFIIILV